MAQSTMGKTPRAVVHKQILAAAEEEPNASIETIADTVAGASTDLVERVLDQYGDPADTASMSEQETVIDLDELTTEQRETLEAVYRHPDATQQELADELDVSSPTISQRLSSIDGFDWQDRGPIVREVFNGADHDANESTHEMNPEDGEEDAEQKATTEQSSFEKQVATRLTTIEEQVDEINATIDSYESRLSDLEAALDGQHDDAKTDPTGVAADDPELAAKAIRAVMADEAISEEEEVQLIQALQAGQAE